MKQHPSPPSPATGALLPTDQARWTPAKQRLFLATLIQTGSVARAARSAGMSRSSAHRLRRRLAGTPFDQDWNRALALHAQRLADPFLPDRPAPTTPASPQAHG